MNHIDTTVKAIKNVGGVNEMATLLSEYTGINKAKMYDRVWKWQINGVSRDFIKPLAKFGKVPVTKLIPDIYGEK